MMHPFVVTAWNPFGRADASLDLTCEWEFIEELSDLLKCVTPCPFDMFNGILLVNFNGISHWVTNSVENSMGGDDADEPQQTNTTGYDGHNGHGPPNYATNGISNETTATASHGATNGIANGVANRGRHPLRHHQNHNANNTFSYPLPTHSPEQVDMLPPSVEDVSIEAFIPYKLTQRYLRRREPFEVVPLDDPFGT